MENGFAWATILMLVLGADPGGALPAVETVAPAPRRVQAADPAVHPAPAEARVEADLARLRALEERAVRLRRETVAFRRELAARPDPRAPLRGADLARLREGTLAHRAVREELLAMALRYEPWLDADAAPADRRTRARGLLVGTAAAALLYDAFEDAVRPFQEDAALRRLANQGDAGYGLREDELLAAARAFASPPLRARARRALRLLEAHRDVLDPAAPEVAWALRRVEASPALRAIRHGSPAEDVALWLEERVLRAVDRTREAERSAWHRTLARLFPDPDAGGTPPPGLGRLEPTAAVRADLEGRLEPLDLLLDKSRYRRIDRVIPGYFTHVAIYLGSPEELQALGLWDHPVVVPHREEIRRGARILEAVRAGVRLTTLEAFLNLDDVAVVRVSGRGPEERRAALLRAFRQVGKEYDFNFDAGTSDRLACTEVPYLVLDGPPLAARRVLGRALVTPDDVAAAALAAPGARVVRLYVDGRRVDRAPEAALESLLTRAHAASS